MSRSDDACETVTDAGEADGERTASNDSETATDGERTASNGSERTTDGERTASNDSETATDGERTASNDSETATDRGETTNGGDTATDGGGTMTDGGETDDEPVFAATRYADGSIGYPDHTVAPSGAEPVGTVDLSEHTARVVTWTTAQATPPGVSAPNHLAIVAFDVDGETVRAIGQLTTADVSIGDRVRPVYDPELRDPEAGIREADSHAWDGFRFEPVE